MCDVSLIRMKTLRLATKHLHLAIRTLQEQLFNKDGGAGSNDQPHQTDATPLTTSTTDTSAASYTKTCASASASATNSTSTTSGAGARPRKDSASLLVPEALASQLSYYHSKLADCFLSISLERQRSGQIVAGLEALEASLMERAKLQMLRRGPDPNRPEQCRLLRHAAEDDGEQERKGEGKKKGGNFPKTDTSSGSYKYSYANCRLRPTQTNLFSATDTVSLIEQATGVWGGA